MYFEDMFNSVDIALSCRIFAGGHIPFDFGNYDPPITLSTFLLACYKLGYSKCKQTGEGEQCPLVFFPF